MSNETNIICLPTASAAALWTFELKGQLSDGYWENSRPHDHWRFWSKLTPVVSEELGYRSNETPERDNYNFLALKKYIQDRMLKIGRMAQVAPLTEAEAIRAAEYMPPTLHAFGLVQLPQLKNAWVADYLKKVPLHLAEAYYQTDYTSRQLDNDLRACSEACKLPLKG